MKQHFNKSCFVNSGRGENTTTEPIKHTYKKDPKYLTDHLNWPSVLTKAIIDEYMYMLKLKTGEVYAFENAKYINDEFVWIATTFHVGPYEEMKIPEPSIFFDRGMEIRISDIVWVADCGQSPDEYAEQYKKDFERRRTELMQGAK